MGSRTLHLGLAIAAIGLCAQPLAASAEQGDWLLRGGLGIVDPKSDNLTLPGALSPAEEVQVDTGTSLTFEATYKWKDAELYRYAFNGGNLTSAVINPCLSYKNTVLTVESPCNIDPGTIDFPWKLQVVAPKVRWRMQGPPQLAGDELIQLQLVGTAIEADSGDPEDYFQFILDNEVAAYAIPTS